MARYRLSVRQHHSATRPNSKWVLDIRYPNGKRERRYFATKEEAVLGYCAVAEKAKELPKRSGTLLRDVMLRGAISRGEVARILNVSARTAQAVIGALLAKGLLKSSSPKGQLTIGFPGFICPYLFPDLYPTGSPN